MKNYFYKRNISFLMLVLLIVSFGIFSIFKLERVYEEINTFESICVMTEYPGKTPSEISRKVTEVLEKSLKEVQDLSSISSVTSTGSSKIYLKINKSKNFMKKIDEIRIQMANAAVNLPSDCRKPVVFRSSENESPDMIIAVYGDNFDKQKYDLIRKHTDSMLKLKNINKIEISGILQDQIEISINSYQKEKEREIYKRVGESLARKNLGNVYTYCSDTSSYRISTKDPISGVEDLNSIKYNDSRGILSDLKMRTKIAKRKRLPDKISRYNGKKNAAIYIYTSLNMEAVDLYKEVELLKKNLDNSNLSTEIIVDKFKLKKQSYRQTIKGLLFGLTCTILVMLFFLDSLFQMIALLISLVLMLLLNSIVLNVFKIRISTSMIISFSILAGIMIETPYIMISPLFRKNHRIITLYSALTTCAVFIPLNVFYHHAMVRNISFAFILSTAVSLFISYIFFPNVLFLLEKLKLPSLKNRKYKLALYLNSLRLCEIIKHYLNRYSTELIKCRKILLVILLSLMIPLLCLKPLPALDNDLNNQNEKSLRYKIYFQEGYTLKYTDFLFMDSLPVLKKNKNIENFTYEVAPSIVTLDVKLKAKSLSKHLIAENLLKDIESSINAVVVLENNEKSYKKISFMFYGDDRAELRKQIYKLGSIIFKKTNLKVIYHFGSGSKKINLIPDENSESSFVKEISNNIRISLNQPVVAKYIENGKQRDVVIATEKPHSIESLLSETVSLNSKKLNQLNNIFRIEQNKTNNYLRRKNFQKVDSFSVILRNRKSEALVDSLIKRSVIPEGILSEKVEDENYSKVFVVNIALLLIVSIVLIVCITAAVDNSFKNIVYILGCLGASFLGVFISIDLLSLSITPAGVLAIAAVLGLSVNYAAVVIYSDMDSEILGKYILGMYISTAAGIIPMILIHEKGTFEYNYAFIFAFGLFGAYIYCRLFIERRKQKMVE